MLRFPDFFARPEFTKWHEDFTTALLHRCNPKRWGDEPTWQAAVDALPVVAPSEIDLSADALKIGAESDLNDEQQKVLVETLKSMTPWRKGPFNFFGTLIDTEWRSDWKWQRVAPHLSNSESETGLEGKRVLDVGCGTGYHGWRMLGAGADYVMGIDPSMRFSYQFAMVQKYIQSKKFDFLPIGIEDMPSDMAFFDHVFSMGILYHRKDPEVHLNELKAALKPKGTLVLETLVVDDDYEKVENGVFIPEGRYANMRNVWTIATIQHLIDSLDKAGFENIRCVDVNTTSLDEQRATPWMDWQSLADFLDPENIALTIEGHPAPKRATILADKI